MNDLTEQLINFCAEHNITLDELEQYVHNQNEIKPYECAVKLSRMCDIEIDDLATTHFELDDVIGFTLSDGEYVEAVVVDVNERSGKVTFVLKNCFKDTSSMNKMDDFLFVKFLLFPWSLRKIIENHSLRLLTYSEVFGDGRYQYFYDTANRICYDTDKEATHWWLGSHSSPTYSELVYPCGGASPEGNCAGAGVRPVFTIIQNQEG